MLPMQLKKFEHFITSSLTVALIWMILQRSYSNARGSTNFSYVQFNGGIQMNVLMSIVDKPYDDKMLKFIDEVKLGFIFTLVYFKIAKEKYLAKNLEKPTRGQFWPKMLIFKKTQRPIFMKLSQVSILSTFKYI